MKRTHLILNQQRWCVNWILKIKMALYLHYPPPSKSELKCVLHVAVLCIRVFLVMLFPHSESELFKHKAQAENSLPKHTRFAALQSYGKASSSDSEALWRALWERQRFTTSCHFDTKLNCWVNPTLCQLVIFPGSFNTRIYVPYKNAFWFGSVEGRTSLLGRLGVSVKRTELDHIHDAIKHFSGNQCKTDEPWKQCIWFRTL